MLNTCTLPRQTLPDLTTQFSLDSFTLLETELFLFEVGKMRGKERGGLPLPRGGRAWRRYTGKQRNHLKKLQRLGLVTSRRNRVQIKHCLFKGFPPGPECYSLRRQKVRAKDNTLLSSLGPNVPSITSGADIVVFLLEPPFDWRRIFSCCLFLQ